MTRRTSLLLLIVTVISPAAFAEEPKTEVADKAIAKAIADLKATLDKSKDEAEKRKLAVAVARLEGVLKKPAKDDNHLLLDFADNRSKYEGKTLTFRMRVPKNALPMNEWGYGPVEMSATVGESESKVKVSIVIPDKVVLKCPAIRDGDEAIITILCEKDSGLNVLVEAKRP